MNELLQFIFIFLFFLPLFFLFSGGWPGCWRIFYPVRKEKEGNKVLRAAERGGQSGSRETRGESERGYISPCCPSLGPFGEIPRGCRISVVSITALHAKGPLMCLHTVCAYICSYIHIYYIYVVIYVQVYTLECMLVFANVFSGRLLCGYSREHASAADCMTHRRPRPRRLGSRLRHRSRLRCPSPPVRCLPPLPPPSPWFSSPSRAPRAAPSRKHARSKCLSMMPF